MQVAGRGSELRAAVCAEEYAEPAHSENICALTGYRCPAHCFYHQRGMPQEISLACHVRPTIVWANPIDAIEEFCVNNALKIRPVNSARISAALLSAASLMLGSPALAQADQQVEGSANGIDVAITSQDATTTRPGAAPMRFTVTLVNTTATDYPHVGLVVSLGRCSCNPAGIGMMLSGSMHMLAPGTDNWQEVPYVAEGAGTDFLTRPLVPPFALDHGQTTTYQLELQLDANQATAVRTGESAVHVTMTDGATNTALGATPTASLPITIEP